MNFLISCLCFIVVAQARRGRSLFFHTTLNETMQDLGEIMGESAYHTQQAAQKAVINEWMNMKKHAADGRAKK